MADDTTTTGPGLAEKVAFLSQPEIYADAPESVETRETHMAWVFLTREHAYKLKKPVRFDFLDYTTLDARRRVCRAEIELNRRLAPTTYLGVVTLRQRPDGALTLDSHGEVVDWLVKMRRLPADGFLENAILTGEVPREALADAADLLARFYRDRQPMPQDPDAYLDGLRSTLAANRDDLLNGPEHPVDPARIRALADTLDAAIGDRRELLAGRAARLVDGHGDLRPEHVHLGPPPAVIDCIEFNSAFRHNDPVEEIAFLGMECERLGATWVGPVILNAYTARTDDAPPAELVALYRAKRALLRAKLSLWHLDEAVPNPDKWRDRTATYLAIAERHAETLA
ncbi:Aminoglycoside phosphotransferase family enzyme [Limimonas halophila]|uniref:Aminoglycoside phosphotransferase family enzyme n=1 Tax=Limimonas halophila TaxID=1082479 RepID=A0A1G7M6Q1_9PROT|nr:hypothetical protein [Limimonas halophila]SDF57344.1 Aminoglycoside phosphotransferase family enzyme [Limimonas halophila]